MKPKVIISLTTYDIRINTVALTIISLLQQTKVVDCIILWLSKDEFSMGTIPINLKELQSLGLQIEFCDDLKSYKKLIPTLKMYPNDIIITVDDDVIYEADIVQQMLDSYAEYPDYVHCMRGHKMVLDNNGSLSSYNRWEFCTMDFTPSAKIFPTGVGGILYPPGFYYKDIFDVELFMRLAPHGDDIWFKAMSLLQGKLSRIVPQKQPIILNYIDGTQEHGLWLHNQDEETGNNPQIKAVFDYFHLWNAVCTNL